MAGSGFTVDPEAMRALARHITTLTARLAEIRSISGRVDGGSFGSSKLGGATEGFINAWSWQAERLTATLNDTSTRLAQAADQYQKVEDTQLQMQGTKD